MNKAEKYGGDFLSWIMEKKKSALPTLRDKSEKYEAVALGMPPAQDFVKALSDGSRLHIIAEVKRASPSAGMINPDLDASRQVYDYMTGGASAVSILTEDVIFGGRLQDIADVRANFGIPILQKDFLFDPVQLVAGRIRGSAAALLIVEALSGDMLEKMMKQCEYLGIAGFVETRSEEDVKRAIDAGARIIGVNSRNLHTLEMDKGLFERMAPVLPADVVKVAESGLSTVDDIKAVRSMGYNAVLMGEALVRSGDIFDTMHKLLDAVNDPS